MCENFVEHVMNKTKRKPKNIKTQKKIVNSRKTPRKSHCFVKKQQQLTDYITYF